MVKQNNGKYAWRYLCYTCKDQRVSSGTLKMCRLVK